MSRARALWSPEIKDCGIAEGKKVLFVRIRVPVRRHKTIRKMPELRDLCLTCELKNVTFNTYDITYVITFDTNYDDINTIYFFNAIH